MDTKERYGRFVLLNEDARTSAGSFFRAVQVGPGGYERHVQLFRSELLLPDMAQAVAEGLKTGLQIQHPQVTRGFEAGRLDKTAFAAYEMTEGRSVGALLERSQTEGHPFAADHALLIASKAAAALEAAQAKKRIHGFLVPEFVQVSHDGEVSVRGFGLSPRVLRDANCVGVREAVFLAPEVETSAPLDIRADVFSLGAQLFEMLTGAPLPRTGPTSASIDAARIHSPGHDGAPIPKALAALLLQALAEDPARRFKDAAAFKKAVDTLLFSGDYSPTTFNLAFFMHTLFRDEGDQDAAQIKAEKNADYRAHVAGAMAPAMSPPIPPSPVPHASPKPPETPRAEAARPEPVRAEPSRGGRASTPPTAPAVTATAAASSADDQLFRTVMAEKKSLPIVPIVVVVLALAGVGGYMMTRPGSTPPAPVAAPAMSAAETAALAKVKELEARLAAIEAEKVAAEQKASDEATRKVEAQAKARGKAVDPLELQRAQEEARKQAQAEQAALVQAEKQKIEDERRRAEEARQAEAARVAAEAAKQAEATPAAPPPQSTAAPTVAAAPVAAPPVQTAAPAPSAAASSPAAAPSATSGPVLLDLADPNVVAPVLVSQSRIEYPPMARAQRIIGVVVISALVDEQGNVAEARVIRGAPSNSGLNEAALANVKKRKYKPGTLNGKPGRTWVAIQIDFKL